MLSVALGAHRDGDAGVAAALTEDQRDELAALVRVMDQAGGRPAPRDGHLQGVDDEPAVETPSVEQSSETGNVAFFAAMNRNTLTASRSRRRPWPA